MQAISFGRLSKRLKAGGVAPRYVKRMVRELESHLEELVDQEKDNGLASDEARAAALIKLGDEDKLVEEALARKEIQSWSRRYTKSFYLLVPVTVYLAAMSSFIFFGISAVSGLAKADVAGEFQYLYFGLAKFILVTIEYIITPFIAAVFAFLAIRRNVEMMWPFVGILILSFFGSGFETVLQTPVEGSSEGGISLIWGWSFLPWRWVQPPWDQTSEQFLRIVITMAMVTLLYKFYKPYAERPVK